MSEILLNADKISFNTHNRSIFSDVSMKLARNDIVSVIGVNGSGKSVFLQIISGILKQYSGSVLLSKNVKISYMPQKIFISSHLPIAVKDFFALQIDKIDKELLYKLNITDDLLDKKLYTISGGQMQKVLFAITIMNKADILILDEPEQNLDIRSKLLLYELISEYAVNKAVIIASHDPNIVFKKSNKVLHFDICCAVHYDNIKNNNIDIKIKDLFEDYFDCHKN